MLNAWTYSGLLKWISISYAQMSYHIFLRTKVRRVRRLNAHYKTRGTKNSESATNKHCVVLLLIKLSFKVLLLRRTFSLILLLDPYLFDEWIWAMHECWYCSKMLIFVLGFRTPLGKNRSRFFYSAKMSFVYYLHIYIKYRHGQWAP